MSEGNVTMDTMTTKEKCKHLSDFFLPVFEDYWGKGGDYDGDVVEFCLFTNNLAFQIAFAVEHGMVSEEGLSKTAISDIDNTYQIMVEGTKTNSDF
jgi:hypothetical protein